MFFYRLFVFTFILLFNVTCTLHAKPFSKEKKDLPTHTFQLTSQLDPATTLSTFQKFYQKLLMRDQQITSELQERYPQIHLDPYKLNHPPIYVTIAWTLLISFIAFPTLLGFDIFLNWKTPLKQNLDYLLYFFFTFALGTFFTKVFPGSWNGSWQFQMDKFGGEYSSRPKLTAIITVLVSWFFTSFFILYHWGQGSWQGFIGYSEEPSLAIFGNAAMAGFLTPVLFTLFLFLGKTKYITALPFALFQGILLLAKGLIPQKLLILIEKKRENIPQSFQDSYIEEQKIAQKQGFFTQLFFQAA